MIASYVQKYVYLIVSLSFFDVWIFIKQSQLSDILYIMNMK